MDKILFLTNRADEVLTKSAESFDDEDLFGPMFKVANSECDGELDDVYGCKDEFKDEERYNMI